MKLQSIMTLLLAFHFCNTEISCAAAGEQQDSELRLAKLSISRQYFLSQPLDFENPLNLTFFRLPLWSPTNADLAAIESGKAFSSKTFHMFGGSSQYHEPELAATAIEGGFLSSYAHFCLATLRRETGRFDEALLSYEKAAADPDLRKECLFWRAHILHSQGEMKKGLEVGQELERLPPYSCETLALLSSLYKNNGNIEKAIYFAKLLLESDREINKHLSPTALKAYGLHQVEASAMHLKELEDLKHNKNEHSP